MKYRATTVAPGGRRETLEREGERREDVARSLRAEGRVVVALEEIATREDAGFSHSPLYALRRMGSFDVEMGLRQLASMVKSGITLLAALETVAAQAASRTARRTWEDVAARVLAGRSFAQSLAAHAGKFGEITIRLAEVGEKSGELEHALAKAADQLESRRNLRTAVVNAVSYPIVAVLMAIAVSAYLVLGVIPKLSEFLRSGGAELPAVTKALVDFSNFVRMNGLAILAAIGAAAAAWIVVRLWKPGKEAEDVFLLRLPVAGRILRLSGTALFCRSMQIMLESGVSLVEAMETASRLLANRRLARRVATARESVVAGRTLEEALAPAREFMPMVRRMAAIGEVTGALPETFGETARFHEMLLALAVKRLGMLIEPVMIVVTGGIVGFVYIAFFMALFAIAGTN